MTIYISAISAAMLWAISAQFASISLNNAPISNTKAWMGMGLLIALITGTTVLGLQIQKVDVVNGTELNIVLAGVFTFVLGTGAYYMAGDSLSKRGEYASIFSKVKPLFSFIIAFMILGESINTGTTVSIGFIILGIIVLFGGVKYDKMDPMGIVWGLFCALFWAVGEYFMQIGMEVGYHPLLATFHAMLAGTLVYGVLIIPYIIHSKSITIELVKKQWAFVIHGILSFGLAYPLFFDSINDIGIGQTILVSSFWPIMALILATIIGYLKKDIVRVPRSIIISSMLIVTGSLVQILS